MSNPNEPIQLVSALVARLDETNFVLLDNNFDEQGREALGRMNREVLKAARAWIAERVRTTAAGEK